MIGKRFSFALLVLSMVWVASLSTETEDVIQLDLSPLRVQATTQIPPQKRVLGRNDLPPKNDSKVYCTNSVLPNDIFCDIGSTGRIDLHQVQPLTTDFFLKFRHQNRSKTQCYLSFGSSEDGPPSMLVYESFGCFDASDSEVDSQWLSWVEWRIKQGEVSVVPDAVLPEGLKVADVDVLEVEDVSPVNFALKCKRRLKKSEQAVEESTSFVAFDVDSMECISTVSFPEQPTPSPQE